MKRRGISEKPGAMAVYEWLCYGLDDDNFRLELEPGVSHDLCPITSDQLQGDNDRLRIEVDRLTQAFEVTESMEALKA